MDVLTLSLVSGVLAAASASPTAPASVDPISKHFVAGADQELSGPLFLESLTIPRGVVVTVTDDLVIESSGRVVIEGDLVARDRSSGQPDLAGPRIVIRSGEQIDVRGRILGGRGGSVDPSDREGELGRYGEAGSDILLEAPLIWVDGIVVGGPGGRSAAGAEGPRGGDVVFVGQFLTREEDPEPEAVGGAGGFGGEGFGRYPDGGSGGAGGGVFVLAPFPTSVPIPSFDANAKENAEFAFGMASMLEDAAGCTGVKGARGGDATGGVGGAGANGAAGTPANLNGGNGGTGGPGGPGPAGNGLPGTAGGDCCTPPQWGGAGGEGGDGGWGVGGRGGPGGNGGMAWQNAQGVTGVGGAGGTGGPGGTGTGGSAGPGGAGGINNPAPPGGGAGVLGLGTAGGGGAGGAGGAGNPAGAPGPDGGHGGAVQGNGNNPGPNGKKCPVDEDPPEGGDGDQNG